MIGHRECWPKKRCSRSGTIGVRNWAADLSAAKNEHIPRAQIRQAAEPDAGRHDPINIGTRSGSG